jgi:hypothetical protein
MTSPQARPAVARRRRAAIAVALLAVGALAMALAPEAAAGTYRAVQCHEGLGAGRADARFTNSSPRYVADADCEGKGLGITHDAGRERTPGGRFGAWTLAAPAGAEIVGVTAGVSAAGADGHTPQLYVGRGDGARVAIAGLRGRRHSVRWSGTTGRALTARLACARRTACGAGRRAHIHLRRIAVTLRDVARPVLAPSGELLGAGSRRGFQALRIAARDTGSGVRSMTVEVNGDPLVTRRLDCELADRVALRLRPCPAGPSSAFDLATTSTSFRQGPNQLRVCASDYAPRGTANRTCLARTVRIDNLCPLSDVAGSTLRARFRGSGSRLATRSDRPAVVHGRLTGESGPVAGARVCVAARVRGTGGAERIVATPTTNADGSFTARIPAGPNREIRIAHWPNATRAHERYLSLKARAIPRLRLRPRRELANGERVRFGVRLPEPASARRRVVIQARSGHRWIRIAGGRTSAKGTWRGDYRFRSTTGSRRYAFRARVPKQPGYPYAAGRSAIRRVSVDGRTASKSKTG